MDPNNWVEQLFTYGPYAVLALFALWVAPKQTKEFLRISREDKGQRYLCGGISVASWLVVLAMVWFIYLYWPPRIVYQGTFGIYGEDTEFISQHNDFYISTELLDGGRLKWKFAIVTDSSRRDPNITFDFTRRLNKVPKDYSIRLKDLASGHVHVHIKPDAPEILMLDDQELKPIANSSRKFFAERESTMVAYAQDNEDDYLIKALTSTNPYLQAQGRKKLREIHESTLKDLLKRDGMPQETREQLQRELGRRTQP